MVISLLQVQRLERHLMFPLGNIGFILKKTYCTWLRMGKYGLEKMGTLFHVKRDSFQMSKMVEHPAHCGLQRKLGITSQQQGK